MNPDDPIVMPQAPINGPSKSDRYYSGVMGTRREVAIPVSKTTAPLASSGMVPVKRKTAKKVF